MNELKPEKVFVEIKNEKWEIKYDFNSLSDIEDYYGSFEKAFAKDNIVKLKTIRYLLWQGCSFNPEFRKIYASPIILGKDLKLPDIVKLKTIRYLLWQGCSFNPEFRKIYASPIILGKDLKLPDLEKYADALSKAFENALPKVKLKKVEEPAPE